MTPRTRIVAILAMVPLMVCGAAPRDVAAQGAENGVVKIRNDVKGRNGSGFVVQIHPGVAAIIVTAAHVVADDKTPTVTFLGQSPRLMKGEVLARQGAADDDLAVVLVQGDVPLHVVALELDTHSTIARGDRVVMIGFPRLLRTPWARIEGQVAGRRDGSSIVIAGVAQEGNSGGPVLNTGGRVVGVLYGGDERTAFAVPASIVRTTVEGWDVRLLGNTPSMCSALDQLTGMAKNSFKDLRQGSGTPDKNGLYRSWTVPSHLDLSGRGMSSIRKVDDEHEFYLGYIGPGLRERDMTGYWQSLVERVKTCLSGWSVKYEKTNEARFEGPFKVFRGKIVVEVGVLGPADKDKEQLAYIGVGNWFKGPYGRD